jgi:2,3-bisphosphoglycerate-independent phosphoglycerate mutase
VVILVVPDGAADPLGATPTCLEEARTPTLDALCRGGTLLRVRTIPRGLPAGSEVGIPSLLGVRLSAPPSRGRIEAAAAGIAIRGDEGAWRLDVLPAGTVEDATLARLDDAIAQLGGRVHRLSGHRLLLTGPAWWGDAPPGPHQTERPLREFAVGPFGGVAKAAKAVLFPRLAWPWGTVGATPSAHADGSTWPRLHATVVTSGGAAAGVARLLGCTVRDTIPDDLDALVVVHVPDPDDAAHARDRAAKISALERLDAEILAPLAGRGVSLIVSPDHGCDPATGRHTAEPVLALVWSGAGERDRFTERAVADRAITEAHQLLEREAAA